MIDSYLTKPGFYLYECSNIYLFIQIMVNSLRYFEVWCYYE